MHLYHSLIVPIIVRIVSGIVGLDCWALTWTVVWCYLFNIQTFQTWNISRNIIYGMFSKRNYLGGLVRGYYISYIILCIMYSYDVSWRVEQKMWRKKHFSVKVKYIIIMWKWIWLNIMWHNHLELFTISTSRRIPRHSTANDLED